MLKVYWATFYSVRFSYSPDVATDLLLGFQQYTNQPLIASSASYTWEVAKYSCSLWALLKMLSFRECQTTNALVGSYAVAVMCELMVKWYMTRAICSGLLTQPQPHRIILYWQSGTLINLYTTHEGQSILISCIDTAVNLINQSSVSR